MKRLKDIISEKFLHLTKYVVPIYKNDEFDKSIYASSLLVHYMDNILLITASHVIDVLGHDQLYIFNGVSLEKLQCNALLVKSSSKFDSVDLSILRLSDHSIKMLSKMHKVMSLDSIDNSLRNRPGLIYLVIGYPYSKNRFRSIVKSPTALFYFGSEVEETMYKELKTDQSKEFILRIEKENIQDMNPDNIIQDLPYLNGISGGGVWCIVNPDINDLLPPCPIGIVREITPKKDALRISRIQYMIPAFNKLLEIENK